MKYQISAMVVYYDEIEADSEEEAIDIYRLCDRKVREDGQ